MLTPRRFALHLVMNFTLLLLPKASAGETDDPQSFQVRFQLRVGEDSIVRIFCLGIFQDRTSGRNRLLQISLVSSSESSTPHLVAPLVIQTLFDPVSNVLFNVNPSSADSLEENMDLFHSSSEFQPRYSSQSFYRFLLKQRTWNGYQCTIRYAVLTRSLYSV